MLKTTKASEPKGRVFAIQIVAAQFAFTCAIALSSALINYSVTAAVLCGGLICTLANLWLAIVAYRPKMWATPSQMLMAFYVGEVGKFLITAMLFMIVFKNSTLFKQPLYALLLITTYVFVQCITWVYPLARSKLIARHRR